MADVFTPARRSEIMAAVRSTDTKPEMALRRSLHSKGLRYLLHVRQLPGKPDIVLPRHGIAIQVRGCFWHGHKCPRGHAPSSRQEFWLPKLAANKKRDARNDRALRAMGWRVLVIWECKLRTRAELSRQLRRVQAAI